MVHFPHKILIPQRPPYLVPRPRLTDLLQAIVDRRLITLSAPAGYGKTSLLTDFASTTASLPVCWYTLDRFDEDPWVFLGYLAASVAQRFPGAMQRTEAVLAGRSRNPFATAAAALVRDIYEIGDDFVLLIDDWHLVDHIAEISEVIAQLLLHCSHCHLILASRIYPSLPDLMLLAARRQMSGLDEEQLRFTAPEISAVLGAEYHTTVPIERAQTLTDQSNGWIAGILLALEVTGPDAPSLVPLESRAERQIYRFLAEQVFDRQPEPIRAFLLQSALLEELTPEGCNAVFQRTDSAGLLEILLRHHLFVTEIRPGVLRYHPLFREFLQEHYRTHDSQGYRSTALKVADAYAAQGQWMLAFDISLAAGDVAAAQRIVAVGGEQLYTSGRLETLERWFAALPLDELDAPLLCLRARVLLNRGGAREAQALAELAEARMHAGEEEVVLLLQAQIAHIGGRYEQALGITQHVLLLAREPAHRALALRTAAICHHRLGDSARGLDALNQALAIERQRGDPYSIAMLQHDLGVFHENIGELQQAVEYYSQADGYWAVIGNTGMRAMSLNGKGAVEHLMGDYRNAYRTLDEALQHARDASVTAYQATVLASLGDLYSDLGLWNEASAVYDEARQLGGSAYLMGYLELAIVRLLVRQREYEAADAALRRLPEATAGHQTAEVRLLHAGIACGLSNYKQATRDVEQALRELEPASRPIDVARAWLLRAQIAAGSTPAASAALLAALDRAARIGDQLGYDAFLVAETLHMGTLLRHAGAAGWTRAADWLQRQREMRLLARSLPGASGRPLLLVRTLGADQIVLDGQPLDVGWHKAREVFYYLLAHPHGVALDVLHEAIWPELGYDGGRNALKTAIYQLRAALPRELIQLHGRQVYMLNRDLVDFNYDVERFLEILDTCTDDAEACFEALDLYTGPYLPSSDNQWSSMLRFSLEQRYLQTLRTTAERCEQARAYLDALTLYQHLLVLDALDEASHAGVMRCQIALGNRAAAINQYQVLRHILDEELGLDLDHASEVEQLYSRILATS